MLYDMVVIPDALIANPAPHSLLVQMTDGSWRMSVGCCKRNQLVILNVGAI
jgi:hypothetical protein